MLFVRKLFVSLIKRKCFITRMLAIRIDSISTSNSREEESIRRLVTCDGVRLGLPLIARDWLMFYYFGV